MVYGDQVKLDFSVSLIQGLRCLPREQGVLSSNVGR